MNEAFWPFYFKPFYAINYVYLNGKRKYDCFTTLTIHTYSEFMFSLEYLQLVECNGEEIIYTNRRCFRLK